MGKNLTIYLPDDVIKGMEKFTEVNWSEICRRAITEYLETRSVPNFGAILERLKNEKGAEYAQGRKLAYELISVIPYSELAKIVEGYEDMRLKSKINEVVGVDDYAGMFLSTYWEDIAHKYSKKEVTKAFVKGFRDALLEIYQKT